MRKINIVFICLFSILISLKCTKDPLDKEQYIKQIYLVGAYNKTFTQTVMYHDTEPQETFVSVAASGSLGLDRDVNVTLGIVPEAVAVYNEKYIGRYSSLPYFSVLPDDIYHIPSLQPILKAGGEIYERVPVILNTSLIHCDSTYALPFKIKAVSDYQATEDSILLLTFDMKNKYSAVYAMSASMHLLDDAGLETDTVRSGRNKILKAISQFETRMFFYDHTEMDENITSDCLVLAVDPVDNSVHVEAWDDSHFIYGTILDSGGKYSPDEKTFDVWYTFKDKENTYKIVEFLESN